MNDEVTTLSPDELLSRLSMMGVKMTRRNLLGIEKAGCVSPAERGGGGPGGAYAKYQPEALLQAYVSWKMTHGSYGDPFLKELVCGAAPRFSLRAIKITRKIFDEKKTVVEYFESYQAKPILSQAFLEFALSVYSLVWSEGQSIKFLAEKKSRE